MFIQYSGVVYRLMLTHLSWRQPDQRTTLPVIVTRCPRPTRRAILPSLPSWMDPNPIQRRFGTAGALSGAWNGPDPTRSGQPVCLSRPVPAVAEGRGPLVHLGSWPSPFPLPLERESTPPLCRYSEGRGARSLCWCHP